ncbi:hypothetical protein KJ359_011245 [Pestalotiopsis sp. 9143b]|nr:hypothetical protein KJ359_011245 [Pestalotiopsis sp. 9143b]
MSEYSTKQMWSAMAKAEHELLTPRSHFKLTDPEFDDIETDHPGTGWLPDSIPIAFRDIEKWDDFNGPNINAAMGRLFGVDLSDLPRSIERAWDKLDYTIPIEVEEDLDNFFLDVIAPILRHASLQKGGIHD